VTSRQRCCRLGRDAIRVTSSQSWVCVSNLLTVSTRMNDDEFNFSSSNPQGYVSRRGQCCSLDRTPHACFHFAPHYVQVSPSTHLSIMCVALSIISLRNNFKLFSQILSSFSWCLILSSFLLSLILTLREKRWLFNIGETHESWYRFYSYLGTFHTPFVSVLFADFKALRIGPLLSTLPTQASLFFGLF
jgi:hypothetical protein